MSNVLACSDLRKSFGDVPVLRGVSLSLAAGTVTALAGENGAGKSTLIKIASGQIRPDSGAITVDGTPLSAGNSVEAHKLGVAIVPQELASIPDMAVYENLFVGHELRRWGILDRRAMIRGAEEALADFDVTIRVTDPMRSLPVGLQQIVEIVKATRTGAKVILLDEPTSAISSREVASLYRVVERLRDHGVAVMFTTHKMEEMRALADRVIVLRDGILALDQSMDDTRDAAIVKAMIGRELDTLFPPRTTPQSDEMLQVRGLQVVGAAGEVDLVVRRGEILGLAGLVGAGRTELIEGIFGVRRTTSGSIAVGSAKVARQQPPTSIRVGMALVPEDRKAAGAFLGMSVLDNATIPQLSTFSIGGWLLGSTRRRTVSQAMASVRLKSRGLDQDVGTLSGGNQQKVVLARWLPGEVKVLLLDEPTRGVDVGARSEIYRIITDLAASGVAVLMASSDMAEILGLAHRTLVMQRGLVTGELLEDDLLQPDAQARIFELATSLDDHRTVDDHEHARATHLSPSSKDIS